MDLFFKSKANLEVAVVDYVEPQFDSGIDPIILGQCFVLDGCIQEFEPLLENPAPVHQ